eukprot:SAG11_NODE_3808_length_2212_cov_2.636536_2_plen_223_part_00
MFTNYLFKAFYPFSHARSCTRVGCHASTKSGGRCRALLQELMALEEGRSFSKRGSIEEHVPRNYNGVLARLWQHPQLASRAQRSLITRLSRWIPAATGAAPTGLAHHANLKGDAAPGGTGLGFRFGAEVRLSGAGGLSGCLSSKTSPNDFFALVTNVFSTQLQWVCGRALLRPHHNTWTSMHAGARTPRRLEPTPYTHIVSDATARPQPAQPAAAAAPCRRQ